MIQGPSIQAPAAGQAQFGAARKPQQGAPKFGMIDGGLITCPVACATCCAAPLAIPVIGFLLFKLIKGLKSGVGSVTSGIKNIIPKKNKADGAAE